MKAETQDYIFLPTSGVSRIHLVLPDRQIVLSDKEEDAGRRFNQHLYLLSDDEIGEGDYFLKGRMIVKCFKREGDLAVDEMGFKYGAAGRRKITATTNPEFGDILSIASSDAEYIVSNH